MQDSTSAACFLCMQKSENQIKIFSEEGRHLNIKFIISKHFTLQLPNEKTVPYICLSCWSTLSQFHELYERVVKAHNNLKAEEPIVCQEIDPFTSAPDVHKCEDVNSVEHDLIDALGENYFDSEIKLEVHDLDLLPPTEIIEDSPYVSERALRANRRNRQLDEDKATNYVPQTKRIKEEPFSRDIQSDNVVESCKPSAKSTAQTSCETSNIKKRRGRPKKITEPVETSTDKIANNDAKIKEELINSDSDSCEDPTFVATGVPSCTEDSASSSSDSVSGKSLPDIEPEERYAVIPKRKVLKPKKYRKRPKPLVPPRRMTREEIDKRNAQQAEYDEIITKFFKKYSCPKCTLLVRNFKDMKKHFRASHGDEPGYMMCCGRKFQLRKPLAEHICIHWNPEHFKCSKTDCGKVFQDSRNLELHELSHTNPSEFKEKKTFSCDKCPKVYASKAALEHHAFAHMPQSEFQFPCEDCKKKFPTLRKLKEHMKHAHGPESMIICDKCGKLIRQTNLRNHHQLMHSETPKPAPDPVQCQICGTWLKHLQGLREHTRALHEDTGGEYRCHICNRTSANKRALRRHIYLNHECERKHKCNMCEKAFKRLQDLREHKSTHTGEVLYTCPNCPMTFFCNANMYKHRQRLHRAEYEADRKKPVPPNIRQQAICATAATKLKQDTAATSAFFSQK